MPPPRKMTRTESKYICFTIAADLFQVIVSKIIVYVVLLVRSLFALRAFLILFSSASTTVLINRFSRINCYFK